MATIVLVLPVARIEGDDTVMTYSIRFGRVVDSGFKFPPTISSPYITFVAYEEVAELTEKQ